MRIKLTLEKMGSASLIPINYNYELSAWIYSRIRQADEEYADFLHNRGYSLTTNSISAGKQFKFFTFSALQMKGKPEGDRLQLQTDEARLVVSFLVEEASEKFIMGLFEKQELQLGDKISQVDFRVKQVESLPWQLIEERVRFRTISPLTVSRKNERGLDDYLPPDDVDFTGLLLRNLLDKYVATGREVPASWQDYPFDFTVLTREPRAKLITLKAHTRQQTRVKGYLFDFELTAPMPLLEIAYLAGLGRYNAEGFGCVEILE
jgi:CRISPR-associated endoribonuclease Cas6